MKSILIYLLLSSLFSLLLSSFVYPATYYVDPFGNDSLSGFTPHTAWKSLKKVNSVAFKAGDKILFRAGGVWYGILRIVAQNGTPNHRIKYSTYGVGNKPAIVGTSALPHRLTANFRDGWLKLDNHMLVTKTHWTNQVFCKSRRLNKAPSLHKIVENEWFWIRGKLYLCFDDKSNCLDNLVLARETEGILLKSSSYVTIQGLDIWGAKGNSDIPGEICLIEAQNVTIKECDIHSCPGYGIILNGCKSIVIDSNNIFDVGLTGIGTASIGEPSKNIIIRDNKIFRVGYLRMDNYHDAHGIGIGNIPGNTFFSIIDNDISECGRGGGENGNVHTGEAVTCWETSNILIRNNYIHDNFHGGIALELGSCTNCVNHTIEGNTICRNGLIKNDGTKYGANYSGIAIIRFGYPWKVENINVVGNYIYDNHLGWEGASASALYITTGKNSILKNVQLIGNKIYNNGFTNYEFWLRPGTGSKIEIKSKDNIIYRNSDKDYLRIGNKLYPYSSDFASFKKDIVSRKEF